MCLGIPMRILETDGFTARCAGRGEVRRVNVMLLDPVESGDWILVHLDNGVRLLEPDEVGTINDALDAILLAAAGQDVDHLFADLNSRRTDPAEEPA